jgi:hypothetical protein
VFSERLAKRWLYIEWKFFPANRTQFDVVFGNKMRANAGFTHGKSLRQRKGVIYPLG